MYEKYTWTSSLNFSFISLIEIFNDGATEPDTAQLVQSFSSTSIPAFSSGVCQPESRILLEIIQGAHAPYSGHFSPISSV